MLGENERSRMSIYWSVIDTTRCQYLKLENKLKIKLLEYMSMKFAEFVNSILN